MARPRPLANPSPLPHPRIVQARSSSSTPVASTPAGSRPANSATAFADAFARLGAGKGMTDPLLSERNPARLRRSTLVYLRWMAILGQSLALLLVGVALGYSLPLGPTLVVVGASVLANILVSLFLPLDRRVGDGEATLQLGFDIAQLGALLYFTGGIANPFALLFLAPVVTGATTLNRGTIAALAALVGLVSAALLNWSHPLPWSEPGGFTLPRTYLWGVWTALVVGIGFTSLYAWRSAAESRRMSAALAATELVLAREQKMSALGGLAAAAAHELGTPLATIQVTAKEMARELDPDTHMGEDARLVLEQARRCRDILTQLSSRGDEGDMMHDRITLEELISEAIEPFIDTNKEFRIHVEGAAPFARNRPSPNISIARRPELLYGLRNLVENAADFAAETVSITAKTTFNAVTLTVADDGPGFDPLVRARLGEPYISSRERTRSGPDSAAPDSAGGLGLGVFIAKTLIERTGGRVRFSDAPGGGALVSLYWPRSALD